MFDLGLKITEMPPSAEEIAKQFNFGTALGLTNTAKEAQSAVLKSLGDTFTLRGQWFKESNRFGIRYKRATTSDLSAAVQTNADWLLLHESGGTKTSTDGHDLAIPTDDVRRNKKLIITKGNRPRALRDKKGVFILQTKNGRVLFQRKGKGKNSKIIALYNLEPKVKIKKESTFYEPINKVANARLTKNIEAGIQKALSTMNKKGRVGSYGPK